MTPQHIKIPDPATVSIHPVLPTLQFLIELIHLSSCIANSILYYIIITIFRRWRRRRWWWVTRILVPDCTTMLERREPPSSESEGPSSVRIRCTVSLREYSSLRLAGGGRAVPDQRDESAMTGEQTFLVYDSSVFLR